MHEIESPNICKMVCVSKANEDANDESERNAWIASKDRLKILPTHIDANEALAREMKHKRDELKRDCNNVA